MPVDYHEPLDDGDIPISSHYVPDVGFIGVQGSPNITTDGSSKRSSPVNLNLAEIGAAVFTLGQKIKDGSISVTLASDEGAIPTLDTNSAAIKSDLDAIKAAVQGTLAVGGSVGVNTISNYATETGGNLASAKADLDTLAGIVSGAKAAIKAATNDIVDLATLLARHNDTFGNNTAISAATTFGAIPLVSALATNSYATLPNNGYQATFSAQINVASAFVGTIAFYGLLPDGTTLQQINAHQRGTATTTNSTAINTGSALEQTWEGSIAAFKAIYVVCSAFTSGAASVQIGLTAADYAHAIINTVAQNLTQLNGATPQLDGPSSNRLGTSLYGKGAGAAGDTPIAMNSDGSVQYDFRKVAGVTLSPSNPSISEDNIRSWIRAGQTFSVTTGRQTSGGSFTTGLSLFNPSASGKNILIYDIHVFHTGAVGSSHQLNLTTTDPALGTTPTALNLKAGGSAGVAVPSYANTNLTPAGTLLRHVPLQASTDTGILTNGTVILLPSGSANGAVFYVVTATSTWEVVFFYVEY